MSEGRWGSAGDYERYIGRWSRIVADRFLAWLAVAPGSRWIDVGCGTGALTSRIIERAQPASVLGVDPSASFVATARANLASDNVSFAVASADALPVPDASADAVVAGLILTFVPDPVAAAAEARRAARPGGVVASYVWDYGGGMQLMRRFWDAAIALDPGAARPDEAQAAIANPDALDATWRTAGLVEVSVEPIDVPTVFADFDDYWSPFLSRVAPAPAYASSLDEGRRDALRERLRATLPTEPDGSIHLVARAWAVQGRRPA